MGALLALLILGAVGSRTEAASPADLKPWTAGSKTAFALDDLTGKRRDLAEFRGKTVLLHFFATWCEPCREEMDSLKRLQELTANKPLAIVTVDVGEVDLRVRAYFEKQPVDFPVLLDRDRAIAKAWEVYGLPSTFVLDANLQPKLFVEGDLDWSHPEVIQKIETLYPPRTAASPRTGG